MKEQKYNFTRSVPGCDECGSKGRRHKKGCPRAGSSQKDYGNEVEIESPSFSNSSAQFEPISVTEAQKVIPPIKFVEVKHLQLKGKTRVEIASLKNLDTDEVAVAMQAKGHSEYLQLRKKP